MNMTSNFCEMLQQKIKKALFLGALHIRGFLSLIFCIKAIFAIFCLNSDGR